MFFRLTKLVPSDAEGTEAGDVGFIVDTAGYRQVENKPLEARSSSPTGSYISTQAPADISLIPPPPLRRGSLVVQ